MDWYYWLSYRYNGYVYVSIKSRCSWGTWRKKNNVK
ncbi:TPA: hypothetical protein N2D99_002346 [Clostridium botulinum]|nr:hypothetical protein [Clostridium botulinum]